MSRLVETIGPSRASAGQRSRSASLVATPRLGLVALAFALALACLAALWLALDARPAAKPAPPSTARAPAPPAPAPSAVPAAEPVAGSAAPTRSPAAVSEHAREKALGDYAALPLAFAPNAGQSDKRVRYLAQGGGYSFFFLSLIHI